MWIVGTAHGQLGAVKSKQLAPKMTDENRVAVRYRHYWNAMEVDNLFKEDFQQLEELRNESLKPRNNLDWITGQRQPI